MYEIELDPRSRGLRSARPDLLRAATKQWPTTDATPEHVAELLRISREMFVHAAFLYDLFTVAAAWGLLALEPALRDRLNAGRNATFRELLERAETRGLLTDDEVQRVSAGIELRHMFAHPERWSVYSPGLSEMLLAATHEVIAKLYGPTLRFE